MMVDAPAVRVLVAPWKSPPKPPEPAFPVAVGSGSASSEICGGAGASEILVSGGIVDVPIDGALEFFVSLGLMVFPMPSTPLAPCFPISETPFAPWSTAFFARFAVELSRYAMTVVVVLEIWRVLNQSWRMYKYLVSTCGCGAGS